MYRELMLDRILIEKLIQLGKEDALEAILT